MKVETKAQVLERLGNAWPLNKEGLKNLLEMAYDAGRSYMPAYLVDANGNISEIPGDKSYVVVKRNA